MMGLSRESPEVRKQPRPLAAGESQAHDSAEQSAPRGRQPDGADVLICTNSLMTPAGQKCFRCGDGPCAVLANRLEKPKPKSKRKSSTSPTQRTLKHMRSLGYLCAVVEHWNPHARIRQDLYGFIDVLCVKGEDIVGVQATSGDNAASRVTKITEHENWPLVCKAIRVVVQGWRKNSKGKWVLREVEL